MYLFDANFFFFSTAVRKLDIVYKAYSLKIQLVIILQDSIADLLESKSYRRVFLWASDFVNGTPPRRLEISTQTLLVKFTQKFYRKCVNVSKI